MGEYRGSRIGVSKGHSGIGPALSPLQRQPGAIGSDSSSFARGKGGVRGDGIVTSNLGGTYTTPGATPPVGGQTPMPGPEVSASSRRR
jgi:hypothetical protein